MRSASFLCLRFFVLAFVLSACGRTELDGTIDYSMHDGFDVVSDRVVGTDANDRVDVPDNHVCRTDTECDDHLFCDGVERCVAGLCTRGTAVACDDGVSCTIDSCNEMLRRCVNPPDDTRCVAPARCDVRRGCTATPCMSDSECDDRNVCNGAESCRAGQCVISAPPICDDGVGCTVDQCDPTRGCFSVPNNALCDDNVFCNGAEACVPLAGGCVQNPPINCTTGNICVTGVCNEAMRACQNTPLDSDNDGFGPPSCGGNDCNDFDARVHPGATEVCTDGADNDCNGLTDCVDPQCIGTPICGRCIPTGPENSSATCTDGRDNDCNGLADCADAPCRVFPFCCQFTQPENTDFACGDGIDNDCNGLIDCADPQCRMTMRCSICTPTGPENSAAACNDGRDNDCNGAVDCADVGCSGTTPCMVANDNCSNVGMITAPGRANGTTIGAHDDSTPTCASGGMAPDVVYTFTLAHAQTVVVDTRGSSFDTVLMIRRDNCQTGPVVGCDDDMGGNFTSLITLTNAPAGTYFVFVDGFGQNAGAYQLTISTLAREICNNGSDDDGDGAIDCNDSDCFTDPFCLACHPTGPENTAAACLNGRDDDCNGLIDCLDPACAMTMPCIGCVPTGPENNPFACTDGRDDDCDRLVDCADPNCVGIAGCGCVPSGPENNPFACSDGIDNDCDGLTDCVDPACAPFMFCSMCVPTGPENSSFACTDGIDNDCNGLRDCVDPSCSGVAPCGCFPTPEVCTDGRDNDCDGQIDCADFDCRTSPVCIVCMPTGPETNDLVCADGRDNDCDMLIDCADPDCAATTPCRACVPTGLENTTAACSDGRDNDCDRLIDCADADCLATTACSTCVPENTDALCSDGRDNDCDALVDCRDPDCAMAAACLVCTPTGPENTDASCSDGRDNDCDRAIDCADPGCMNTTPCVVRPPNDNCNSPILVAVPSTTFGTTAGAVNDFTPTFGQAGCGGGGGPDVVYTFTLTAATPLTIDLNGSFDTVVYVRSASCLAGTQSACNDDFGTTSHSEVAFNAPAGTYFVFADGFGLADQGSFTLRIRIGLPAEICNNGIDDDANGLIDCMDPACNGTPFCGCVPTGPENTASNCADFRDNDCNGLIDCNDPSCTNFPSCCRPQPENCTDGVDNDCDGLIDCNDMDCSGTPTCSVCMPTTGREMGVAQCTDGRDNDCDLTTDCSDSDCQPFGTGTECCDGRDNNSNSIIDEFSCACNTNADCATVGNGGPFPSHVCYTMSFRICGPDCNLIGGNVTCNNIQAGTHCDTVTGECHL